MNRHSNWPPPPATPSERQKAVLRCFRREHDRQPWPTMREIMWLTGISSTSVVRYSLTALMRAGFLTDYSPTILGLRTVAGRAIGLTDKGEEWLAKDLEKKHEPLLRRSA